MSAEEVKTASGGTKRKHPTIHGKYTVCDEESAGVKWTRFPIRVRAHRNPLSDNDDFHPSGPAAVELDEMYPERNGRAVEVVDIGCAYAGLLCRLAPLFPDTLMMGMEIRDKVAEFSRARILALREGKGSSSIKGETCVATHHYNNINVTQGNSMKYLPNYIGKGQLKRLFFCYPDPHFKKKNVRRRIIQDALIHEYAYCMADGGLLYNVTDVKDLSEWMQTHLDASPLFERLTDAEVEADPYIQHVAHASEDAVRTEKKGLSKYYSIHRKRPTPPL